MTAADPTWFAGFSEDDVDVPGARIHLRSHPGPQRAGSPVRPPVVLLHGYPQTGAMWHEVASGLATERPVLVPDLRGYGRSSAIDGNLSFRAMAADVAALLDERGIEAAHVVAHDRGARAAHRLALDHPGRVRSLALLDILPTLAVWRLMGADDGWLARRYWHWPLLAHPVVGPAVVCPDPVTWLRTGLRTLGVGDWLDARALAEYERAAASPGVAQAWCADYAAAGDVDLEHDRLDQGRTLEMPTLVLWGSRGVVGAQVDPVEEWRRVFPQATGRALDAGHFLAEERPEETLALVRRHLA
ncbi:alpha/beta fold hydrolase [Nocardioides acrostichi]|uniref:Alpha/beta hydrolase n=1 Tax=Nocardioides acrostichi TaxID=2784339 RepID=A0A930UVB0_9ACTN|nr:alpha/beta hydrolase [Nocardioides acrostichi]MBF4160841.1 alpha/beta hydrolase [Nocardioides acrostichi]